jgi:hypothetical protein
MFAPLFRNLAPEFCFSPKVKGGACVCNPAYHVGRKRNGGTLHLEDLGDSIAEGEKGEVGDGMQVKLAHDVSAMGFNRLNA